MRRKNHKMKWPKYTMWQWQGAGVGSFGKFSEPASDFIEARNKFC
jgi:hypothetical protein